MLNIAKVQVAQLIKGDGTSYWRRPEVLLILLLWTETSLLLWGRKSSLLLRLIKLYRDSSCWDEGAFWALLRCNIYRPFWTLLRLGTKLRTRGTVLLRGLLSNGL